MRLALAAHVALLCALGGLGALWAQTTIRIEPETIIVPDISAANPFASFDIYIDGVPSPGLGVFQVTIDAFNAGEQVACVGFFLQEIDPALKAAWGGTLLDFTSSQDQNSIVRWNASGVPGRPGPAGTVRLGRLIWLSAFPSSECFTGKQDSFEWVRGGATRFGTGTTLQIEPDVFLGGSWILRRAVDVDLTVACTQTSPASPGVLVDGQTLGLECLVSNLGTEDVPITTSLVALFSADTTVGSSDMRIGSAADVPILTAGSSTTIQISDDGQLPMPQTTNLCVKIDAKESDLDAVTGRLLEMNESNNVECRPLTILEPRKDLVVASGSLALASDPTDPNGVIRAGLLFEVSYGLLNQGIGAVRTNYRTRAHVGASLASIQANPSATALCSKLQKFDSGQFHASGATIHHAYGLDPAPADPNVPAPGEVCKIPFALPPGGYVLAIQADSQNNVIEADPNGGSAPAEENNWASVPITVAEPAPPRFAFYDRSSGFSDSRLEVFGPGTARAGIAVSSARDLAAYSFSLSWSPPALISIGDPNVPGADPSQVSFSTFLEQGGLDQSCSVTAIDEDAGRLDVTCTTTNPGGAVSGGVSEFSTLLADVTFTAAFPGEGTFAISNVTASDSLGRPYAGLRSAGGTFSVSGAPKLSVHNAVPPPAAYPGAAFATSFDIDNAGFGDAPLPVIVDVLISEDPFNDPGDPNSPDLPACTQRESAPVPARTRVTRTLTGCAITEDFRPGTYTAFYQLNPLIDPNTRAIQPVTFPPRVLAIRETSSGKVVEAFGTPEGPGGAAGGRLTRAGDFASPSLAVVRSVPRNRNWLVRLVRRQSGRGALQIQNLPQAQGGRMLVLREVRTPPADRRILGAADVDGDGNDELIVLRSRKGEGARLDFRRLDYRQGFPEICVSGARTEPLGFKVAFATGIQIDADPEDEIAVLGDDGRLSIFDLVLTGSLPPASPCRRVPVVIDEPALAELALVASDEAFGELSGRPLSICSLDWQLDGVEEIAALLRGASGAQSLEIFDAPSGIGGSALLLADDPAFGGVQGKPRTLAIGCTR